MGVDVSEIPEYGRIPAEHARRVYASDTNIGFRITYHNIVAMLGEAGVVKIPRLAPDIARDIGTGVPSSSPERQPDLQAKRAQHTLNREIGFLWHMTDALDDGAPPPPLEVPIMLAENLVSPHYAVTSFVKGGVLSFNELHAFSLAEKKAVGTRMGAFVAWLAGVQTIEAYRQEEAYHRRAVPFDRPTYLIHTLLPRIGQIADAAPTLAKVADELGKEYAAHKQAGLLEPTIVGHHDLHRENLIFRDRELTGVIDFGHVAPSTPEQELFHLRYILGAEAVHAAISYEAATGQAVDLQLIEFWARIQTTGTCTPQVFARGHVIPDWIANQARMYPEYNWSELHGSAA